MKLYARTLSLIALLALGLTNPIYSVTRGLAIYKPKDNITIVVIGDSHMESSMDGAQATQQMREMSSLISRLKKNGTKTIFLSEISDRRALVHAYTAKSWKQTGKCPAFTMLFPVLDSLRFGMEQKNLTHVRYDNRPNDFERLKNDPDRISQGYIQTCYEQAQNIIGSANIPYTVKDFLLDYINKCRQEGVAASKSKTLKSSDKCLRLEIDSNLICKVFEAMNTQEEILIVANGGVLHTIALNEALAVAQIDPIFRQGLVRESDYHAVDHLPQEQKAPIIKNFADIIIAAIEEPGKQLQVIEESIMLKEPELEPWEQEQNKPQIAPLSNQQQRINIVKKGFNIAIGLSAGLVLWNKLMTRI